ncbi:hypothetical protein L1S35_01550 [Flavobacterium sp. AS60]|uniref:hypothetical protein n=1 Tax=Flavobacterium anseongense TaxID=2910677 RepID=UPI001F28EE1E|nr:hypothetical protein [Flavobacterium sp. AS60]MCF6128340.1 hypothetical protein [Flavobacterium sp. AS60]
MALNKLENQIKEKLNSREIQPSAQAWDRLDAMLSVAEEKKTRRPFGFLFIAASITVLLTVGMYFFTQNGTEIQPKDDVVTVSPKDTIVKIPNSKFQIPKESENQVVFSNQPTTVNRQPTTNNQRVSINNQKTTINQNHSNNPLINRDKEIEYQNSSDVALKDLPKIITGNQVISGVNKEIKSDEALLAGLDKKAKQSVNSKSMLQVDAKNLLYQVDGELELTFREKIINKVNKNYQEVKVALANRNNE